MMKSLCTVLGVGLLWSLAGCDEAAKTGNDALKKAKEAGTAAMQQAKSSVDAAKSLVVDNVDVGKDLSAWIESLTKTLSGISNSETAKNATAQVSEAEAKLSALGDKIGKLPEQAKPVLKEMIQKASAALQPLIDKVLAMPGVKENLEPQLKAIRAKLKQFGA